MWNDFTLFSSSLGFIVNIVLKESLRISDNNFVLILGETDWKVICIDTQDPLAEQLNGKILYSNF